MAIPLLTLAAYAYSAKVKGERTAAAAAVEHERKMREEAEKNKVTFGQVWTNGVNTSVVEQGSAAAGRLATMDGWRVVKTGPMKDLSIEIEKEEKKSVPMFFDTSTDSVIPMETNVAANPYAVQIGNYNTETGQGSYFEKTAANWMSSEKMQELRDSFYPSRDLTPIYFDRKNNIIVPIGTEVDLTKPANKDFVQIGTQKSDGTANLFSETILKGMGIGEENLAKTTKNIYSAIHPKGTFTGSLAGLNAWLAENNIPYDDDKLTTTSQVQTMQAEAVTGLTSPEQFDLAKKVEDGEPITDVLITFKDDNGKTQKGYASSMDMTQLSTINVISRTKGTWQGGKFIPSEVTIEDPPKDPNAAATTAAAQQAAKRAGLEMRLDVAENLTIGFGPADIEAGTSKIQLISTQIASNKTAVEDFFKRDPNNSQIPAFVEGVFRLITDEFSKPVAVGDDVFKRYQDFYPTVAQFAADRYKSLVDMIPGLAQRLRDYDEGIRQELTQKVVNENTEPGVNAVAATVNAPAAETGLPTDSKLVIATRYPAQYESVINKVLRPVIQKSVSRTTRVEDPESAVNLALESFVNYEKDFQGRIVKDEQGRNRISDDQPILEFFAGLRPGELERLQTGLAPRSAAAALDQVTQDLLSQYSDIFNGDLMQAVNTTVHLLPSSAGVEAMMDRKYGFGGSVSKKQDFVAGQREVIAASSRGLQVALNARATYLKEDGTLRDSSAVGNILLAFEGFQYLGGRLTDLAANTIGAYASDAREALRVATVNSGGKFISNAAGQAMIQEDLADIQRKVDEADNKAYAQREFFTLVLAYEVAAAIQGGTGGRTISDQDVALIFRGLRQRWTDSPAAQVAALDAVSEMLQRFSFRANMLISDNKSRAAYLIAEDMFTRNGILMDFSMQGVTNYFNKDAPPPTLGGVPGVSEDVIDKRTLQRINNNRQLDKIKPVSMEEAKKLPAWDTTRAREIAKLRPGS